MRLADIRRAIDMLALEARGAPKVAQKQLGHSVIAVTLDTYSQVPKP